MASFTVCGSVGFAWEAAPEAAAAEAHSEKKPSVTVKIRYLVHHCATLNTHTRQQCLLSLQCERAIKSLL